MAVIFNKKFGRFTLVKKLAMGGMAVVYLALKRGPDRFEKLVVLKMLHEHLVGDRKHVDLFYREARLAGTFDHPNLVSVYDADAISNRPTMVMEFVPGATLDEIQARVAAAGEQLDPDLALAIVAQAALGLHAAHTGRDIDGRALDVVHRDVSPHNILVSHHDGGVRVFDFGVAVSGAGDGQGQLAGKTAYMSPEQCRGKQVDARSDVFALGIVLHELLTGAPLFKRDNHIQSIRAITEDEIGAPSAAREGLDPAVDAIVLKALSRDLAGRYPDAKAFHDAIAAYLHGRNATDTAAATIALVERHFRSEIDEITAVVGKILAAPEQSEATIDLATFDIRAEAARGSEIHTDDAGDDGPLAPATVVGGASPIEAAASAAIAGQLQRAKRTSALLALVALLAIGAVVFLVARGGAAPPAAPDAPATDVVPDVAVTIESIPPGASIAIDGQARAETTPAQIYLPPEPATVVVSADGYLAEEVRLNPSAADPESLRLFADLQVDPNSPAAPIGAVRVVYRPADAVVFLNGERVGEGSPVTVDGLRLNQEHQLRLERDGYGTLHFPVVLDSAEPLEVQLEMAEALDLGEVDITSRPSGAEVRVNDEVIGETPIEGLELPAGQYTVEVRRSGYRRWRRAIVLQPGENDELAAQLDREGGRDEAAEPEAGAAANAGGEREPEAAPEPEAEPEPEADPYDML